jgi:hypothetical protein
METAREDVIEDVGALKQPGPAEAAAPAGEGEDLGPELTEEHPPVRRSHLSNILLIKTDCKHGKLSWCPLGVGICCYVTGRQTDCHRQHCSIATLPHLANSVNTPNSAIMHFEVHHHTCCAGRGSSRCNLLCMHCSVMRTPPASCSSCQMTMTGSRDYTGGEQLV